MRASVVAKVVARTPSGGGEAQGDPVSAVAGGAPAPSVTTPSPSLPLDVALHEIGNSLTAVLGWIEAANVTAEGETRVTLQRALARVRQAHRLARSALGSPTASEGPRSLADVLDEVTGALATRANDQGVAIERHVFPALLSVSVGHADRLTQVLTNLCLNALEYAKRGDKVRVTADVAQPGFAVISVADEGPGIPAAVRAGLFRERATTRAGGAGIGLAHSADLARHSGGALHLAPSTLGATFVVTWPFVGSTVRTAAVDGAQSQGSMPGGAARPAPFVDGHATSAARGQAPQALADVLAGRRLLLLEDDLAIAEMLEASLTARGATLFVIHKKRELEQALSGASFDGVLLDLSPIADDPLATLRQVHAKNPGARIVLISGSIECLPILSSDIAVSWVQKPFEMRDVVRALTTPLAPGRSSIRDAG